MPQINQLADAAYSQFFWLLLVLAIIYFGIGRMMLPKIQSTVDARDQRIAGDLAAAQAARTAAEETEAAYRARMDASRGEALKLAQAAKVSSAKATEERMRLANAEIGARVEAAEARMPIRETIVFPAELTDRGSTAPPPEAPTASRTHRRIRGSIGGPK